MIVKVRIKPGEQKSPERSVRHVRLSARSDSESARRMHRSTCRPMPQKLTWCGACAVQTFKSHLPVHDGVVVTLSPANATPVVPRQIVSHMAFTDLQGLIVIDND